MYSPLSRQQIGLYMVHSWSLHWVNLYSIFDTYLIRGLIPQGLMKSLHIVEEEVFGQAVTSLRDRLVVMEIEFLVLDRLQRRSRKIWFYTLPRPYMLIRIAFCSSCPVNSRLVNLLPWSVLKISCLDNSRAWSKADMQNVEYPG